MTPHTASRAKPVEALTQHEVQSSRHFPVKYAATSFPARNDVDRAFVALNIHGYDMDGEHILSTVVDCLSPDAARALAVILLDAAREAVA